MARTKEELEALVAKAWEAYDALSPEEKQAHRREQAISFAYGNLQLSNRTITRGDVEAAYDRRNGV